MKHYTDKVRRGLLEEANAVIEAARDVVAWDWRENDSDCVADMKALSLALDDLTPNVEVRGDEQGA